MTRRSFLPICLTPALPAAAATRTRNIVLVTADGLRWQEVFSGIDPLLMSAKEAHMDKADSLRSRLWRGSPEERRRVLMPFFWDRLAPSGVVLRDVHLTNRYRVSYPGYSEILTGRAQDDAIQGNKEIQNPTPTLLEFLRDRWKLPRNKVGLIGSWKTFHFIGEHTPGSIFINAGFRKIEEPAPSPRLAELSRMQFDLLTPWDSVRHDYITFEMALEYLRRVRPRVLHIAFGETDDWAHDNRYDMVLESIVYFDRCLETLWKTLSEIPDYSGSTSLLITCDHGRGSHLSDWSRHGDKVEGANRIWLAMAGPDTPAVGEPRNPPRVQQCDVAPTLLELAGVDYREYKGVVGSPMRL